MQFALTAVFMNTAINNDQYSSYYSLSWKLILKTLLSLIHECDIKCHYYLTPIECQDCLLMPLLCIMSQYLYFHTAKSLVQSQKSLHAELTISIPPLLNILLALCDTAQQQVP